MDVDIDRRLLEIFKEHAVLRGEFTLSSGLKTTYYFDGRMITLLPEGAYLIGRKISQLLSVAEVEAVGGMSIGADPIVTAVAVVSYLEGKPIPAFIVRAGAKRHGTQKRIEGPLKEGTKVAIVDDVITTGGSVLRAIEAAEEQGCRVVRVVVLLDRQQGGGEEIKLRGYDFTSIFIADSTGEVKLV